MDTNRHERRTVSNRAIILLGLLAALCFSASALFGRLGETEAQLRERFGREIMRTGEKMIEQGKVLSLAENLHFKSDDWHIVARMLGGRCESITYLKPGEWTEEQFQTLLQNNGSREQWAEQKTLTPKTHREWKRRDKATAVWRMLEGMTITTPAYEQAREAMKEDAKTKASRLPKNI